MIFLFVFKRIKSYHFPSVPVQSRRGSTSNNDDTSTKLNSRRTSASGGMDNSSKRVLLSNLGSSQRVLHSNLGRITEQEDNNNPRTSISGNDIANATSQRTSISAAPANASFMSVSNDLTSVSSHRTSISSTLDNQRLESVSSNLNNSKEQERRDSALVHNSVNEDIQTINLEST